MDKPQAIFIILVSASLSSVLFELLHQLTESAVTLYIETAGRNSEMIRTKLVIHVYSPVDT